MENLSTLIVDNRDDNLRDVDNVENLSTLIVDNKYQFTAGGQCGKLIHITCE